MIGSLLGEEGLELSAIQSGGKAMRMNSAKQRRWGKAAVGALALIAMISGLVLVQSDARADGPVFDAGGTASLGTEGNTSGDSGDNDDVINRFTLTADSLQFGKAAFFTPPEFYPPEGTEEPPLGAIAGEISSDSTVGLFGNACNTALHAGSVPPEDWDDYWASPGPKQTMPDIEMYWATADTTTTITHKEQFLDGNGNGLPDGIDSWPDFILRIAPGLEPIRRYFGWAQVGAANVSINTVVFKAGGGGADPAWGPLSATMVNVIGDPGAIPFPRESTTDYCTPGDSLISSYGVSQDLSVTPEDEGGYVLQRNPTCGGTYTFHWHYLSMLDADEDGFENYLDTCPYDVNEDNPKETTGNDLPSADNIDPACEPAGGADVTCWPGSPYDSLSPMQKPSYVYDCDVDGFYNSLDTCPLVPNGCDVLDDCADIASPPWPWNPDWDRQKDSDADTIGDVCDDHPNSPDGVQLTWDWEQDVEIAGPDCTIDTDGDTVPDGVEEDLGSNPNDAESLPEDKTWGSSCTDEKDNDKDGYIDDVDGGCADDTDEDGASDSGEEALGSDPDDPDSKPEDASVGDTCADAVDNDKDGKTDSADTGCAAFTPTAAGSPTATVVAGSPTATVVAGSPTPTAEVENCPPVLPGLYYGRVLIDGAPAQSGYQITAWADDLQWASAFISAGRYAMDVPDFLPTTETCFPAGPLTFKLNGMTCTPVDGADVTWASGINNVDLDCVQAVTPTVAPPTPTPTTPPPPATTPTTKPPATPTTVPFTGAGGLSGSGSGLPLWAMALASWVALTAVAGLGTLVAIKRR
jgi:hypothetical protein